MLRRLQQQYRLSLLAQIQFRRLWLSSFMAELGAKFSMVAIPLLAIAELHAGPLQTGLMVAASAAAFALASLPAGVMADRHSPKKMQMGGQLLMALSLLTVPCAHWLGWLTIEWLYMLEVLLGLSLAVIVAGGQLYAARLAGTARVVEANSLFFGCDSLASLLGPGIAGWLVGLLTPAWAISIDSFCIGISIALLWSNPELNIAAQARGKTASLAAEFMQGWRAVWQTPLLRILSLSGAIFHILFQGHIALQVLLATQVLGLSPFAFGIALMIGGCGALLASLATARGVRRFGEKRLLYLSITALGLCWLMLALMPCNAYTILLYAPVIFAFDMAITSYAILFVSARQMAAPHALMGRITATSRFLAFSAAPLGGILFGWLAQHIGLRWTYACMGGLGLAFSVLLAWMLRGAMIGAHDPATPLSDPGDKAMSV